MTRILFVCLGNICRSPMAEFVMKDLVKKAGLSEQFLIESAGTSRAGGPVYPPAKRKLAEHGISCRGKTSRQLLKEDYDAYDLLIGMDYGNLRSMRRICGDDPKGKMHLLLDFTGHPRDIADPWYTDDFDTAWKDVEKGCRGLLQAVKGTMDRLETGALETMRILSDPELTKKLIDGKNTPLSECVPESEVDW